MWPLTDQERRAALFLVFVLVAGISFKLIFALAPPAQASLRVLDDAVYRPRIDINRAGYTELLSIPHLGPSSAARIIHYRQAHQRIRNADELATVLKKKPAAARALAGYFKWP
jgi:DNA uptake protein ComE-like DNA-binding protein